MRKYKTIGYDEYITFIDTVVSKTVESGGLEYKRFWATLAFAMIFNGYKPETAENGTVSINKEWEKIRNIDVLNSGYDPDIIKEMYIIIDKKLDKIFGASDFERTATMLLQTINGFIEKFQSQFEGEDVKSQLESINGLTEVMKGLNTNEISAIMAKYAHDSKVNENGKEDS